MLAQPLSEGLLRVKNGYGGRLIGTSAVLQIADDIGAPASGTMRKPPVGTQNSGESDGLFAVQDEFPRLALSTKIQTSSGPPPIDPLIAHDQADPGARDLWIGEIDILPNQLRPLAICINQPATRSITPIE
jgi:hypothetical protein